MNVYLSEEIDPEALALLEEHATVVDTFDHPELLDAIIVRRVHVTRDIIARATRLKIIAIHGVGTDTIDCAAAKEAGVPVVNVPYGSTESVAEMALALTLAAARHIPEAREGLEEGRYDHFSPHELIGCELYGKTVGCIGFGHIARRIAQMMKGAFGCTCLAWSRHLTDEEARRAGVLHAKDIHEFMRKSDIVLVCVPLTPQTEGMIGTRELNEAKRSLILVDTARGGVVDEQSLFDALSMRRIAAAALDVTTIEPLPQESPLLALPNFICTPHVGGSTREAKHRVGMETVKHVLSACGISEKAVA